MQRLLADICPRPGMLFQIVLRGCAQLQVLDHVLACHVFPSHWIEVAHLQNP